MTPAQGELKKAEGQKLASAFFYYWRLFGGPGWWTLEKILEEPPAPQYAYDLYHEEARVLIELQGGLWLPKGGHNTAEGINRDAQKLNYAQYLGYACLQLTTDMVCDPDNPAAVFLPLVEFVRIRMELVKAAMGPPTEPPTGRVGVW